MCGISSLDLCRGVRRSKPAAHAGGLSFATARRRLCEASMTRYIAGCFRFFIFTQCFDLAHAAGGLEWVRSNLPALALIAGAGWLCACPVPTHGKGRGDRRRLVTAPTTDLPRMMRSP